MPCESQGRSSRAAIAEIRGKNFLAVADSRRNLEMRPPTFFPRLVSALRRPPRPRSPRCLPALLPVRSSSPPARPPRAPRARTRSSPRAARCRRRPRSVLTRRLSPRTRMAPTQSLTDTHTCRRPVASRPSTLPALRRSSTSAPVSLLRRPEHDRVNGRLSPSARPSRKDAGAFVVFGIGSHGRRRAGDWPGQGRPKVDRSDRVLVVLGWRPHLGFSSRWLVLGLQSLTPSLAPRRLAAPEAPGVLQERHPRPHWLWLAGSRTGPQRPRQRHERHRRCP